MASKKDACKTLVIEDWKQRMTRDDYKAALQSKGFKFEKTILSYPRRRGEEDIYTNKPKYKYTFRVSRAFEDDPLYGLYVGVGDQ